MLPSSSSSRPPPLTQEDISQMSVEELIVLVEDDKRMLELIQHKGLIRKLTLQIFAFTNERSLLPNKDQAANDDFSEELTQRITDLQRSTTNWGHFAQDPARIEAKRIYSTTTKRNREDVENEDDPDREDSYDGGAKRAAMSQSAAEEDQAANDAFSDESIQKSSNSKDTTTIWKPSSSSSRPPLLTPEAISEMSAEELIALVDDDERMAEVIQDADIKNTLVDQIIALRTQRRLQPWKSKKENNACSDKLLQRILDLQRSTTIWDHFAQDPARIETKRIYSTTTKRNREDVENEDDPDREDSYDGGTKRAAMSQSAAEEDQAANDAFSDESIQKSSNSKDTTTIWKPSSSSSRPTSLTPEVISQMSAEELIALVDDDERMTEAIQDRHLKRKLRFHIEQLGDEGSLLPDEDQDANDACSDKLLQRILDLQRSTTIWDHFAQDPARIETKRIYSTTTKRNREDVENEDDLDREDSYNGGTKRAAKSQSPAESSTQSETPRSQEIPSSQRTQATTMVPEYFMPLYARTWKIEEEKGSAAAIKLFSRKRAMFIDKCYALNSRAYDSFEESQVREYMLKILWYVLQAGMEKILPDVITDANAENMVIDVDMKANIQVAASFFHQRVVLGISVRDRVKEEKIRIRLRKIGENETGAKADRRNSLSDALSNLLTNALMTMLECSTPETLKQHPIQLINDYYAQVWAPRNKEAAQEANPEKYEDFRKVIENNIPKRNPPLNASSSQTQNNLSIGSPVAQLCLYMVSTGMNFGALTNGPKTYFFRRHANARTVEVSEAFYSNRNDAEGHKNPGDWSLGQAWLVFLYHALKDHNPARDADLNWLRDTSVVTGETIDQIQSGKVNVSASVTEYPYEGSASAGANSTRGNSTSRRASRFRSYGTQRDPTVLTAFQLGPYLETPNMRAVLGDKAIGYPDIMINGVSSFVKTTYALHDSAYALEHEGKVYAALHTLQGDVVPRVTACGLDEKLNLVVFATEQCGTSLCDLQTRELEEYGGLDKLYWKAALALEKIHKAGFIHGDVALRNIVVDDASNVRFIDLERSKKSRSEALREEDFDLLADAFDVDYTRDFRTLSRTNNIEAHAESNEIV